MLMPALLVIWLLLSCQNCFAAEKQSVQDHSCCPSMKAEMPEPVKQKNQHDVQCKNDCTIKAHQKSDISDRLSLEKQILLGLVQGQAINLEYLKITRHLVPRDNHERQFRPSVFESYRILLI
jgi:hypothetical protein